jgi:hypothetical protein
MRSAATPSVATAMLEGAGYRRGRPTQLDPALTSPVAAAQRPRMQRPRPLDSAELEKDEESPPPARGATSGGEWPPPPSPLPPAPPPPPTASVCTRCNAILDAPARAAICYTGGLARRSIAGAAASNRLPGSGARSASSGTRSDPVGSAVVGGRSSSGRSSVGAIGSGGGGAAPQAVFGAGATNESKLGDVSDEGPRKASSGAAPDRGAGGGGKGAVAAKSGAGSDAGGGGGSGGGSGGGGGSRGAAAGGGGGFKARLRNTISISIEDSDAEPGSDAGEIRVLTPPPVRACHDGRGVLATGVVCPPRWRCARAVGRPLCKA